MDIEAEREAMIGDVNFFLSPHFDQVGIDKNGDLFEGLFAFFVRLATDKYLIFCFFLKCFYLLNSLKNSIIYRGFEFSATLFVLIIVYRNNYFFFTIFLQFFK